MCYYGFRANLWTSWSKANLDKRFFSCTKFKVSVDFSFLFFSFVVNYQLNVAIVHLFSFFSNLSIECNGFGCTYYRIRGMGRDVGSLYGLIQMCLRE